MKTMSFAAVITILGGSLLFQDPAPNDPARPNSPPRNRKPVRQGNFRNNNQGFGRAQSPPLGNQGAADFAQPPTRPNPNQGQPFNNPRPAPGQADGFNFNQFGPGPMGQPGAMPPSRLQGQIDSKLRQYRNADDETERKKIMEEIRETLSEQFDERMKSPKERIQRSRKRLERLKKQLNEREKKSDEIIDLRLKVLTNQALGLGWGTAHDAGQPPVGYSLSPGPGATWIPRHQAPGVQQTMPPHPNGRFPNQPGFQPEGEMLAPGSGRNHNIVPRPDQGNFGITQPLPNRNERYPERIQPDRGNPNRQPSPENRPVTVGEILGDFKQAKDDKERKAISDALREKLVEEFAQHQEQLRRMIKQIDQQISELETILEKRKQAKESIVDLKLKTLINQANGLGF